MSLIQEHPTHQQLAAFLWGQLDDAEQERVEEHVGQCEACCQVLREVPENTVLGRLRTGEKPSEQPTLPQAKAHQVPAELRDHPRYKIGRFLGAGGMGLVFQAEHRVMERTVALKVIHRDLLRNKRAIERFRQEVKAAAKLTHPNIVTAYDAEQAGETHFLVMEFVDGINLARLVAKRGALSVAHACNYVRQAALGLQHAFESGMVHRDIKPHNLMLTRKGQIKILDFGLARLAGESVEIHDGPITGDRPGLTLMGDIIGTPDYMAPEQSLDSRKTDIRADLYSLGCTLYFLVTGRTPFVEGSSRTKVFSHRYFQPQSVVQLREDLPAEIAEVIKKMMAKDPAQRYQTPLDVAKALLPFLKQGPAPAETQAVKELEPAVVEPAPKVSEPARPSRPEKAKFLSRCPYCPTRVRLSVKLLGSSIRCPKCASFFTAVPEEDDGTPLPGEATKQEAAAPTMPGNGDRVPKSSPRLHLPPSRDSLPTWFAPLSAALACATLILAFISVPLAIVAALLLVAVVLACRLRWD